MLNLLKPEWAIPFLAGAGLLIGKIWIIFKKSNIQPINKLTAIGNIETKLREDLMSRLKQTEDRLDNLFQSTSVLNIKVSLQTTEIIKLENLVKNRDLRLRDLTSAVQELLVFLTEQNIKFDSTKIMDLIHVSNQ